MDLGTWFYKFGLKRDELAEFRVRAIRLRKMLENARSLIKLVDDAKEILAGEYIFDRHYVLSLVEKILTFLNKIVFDACILFPASGEPLYHRLDVHKRHALTVFFDSGFSMTERASGSSPGVELKLQAMSDALSESSLTIDEPEYRLLSAVLHWATVGVTESEGSVVTFIGEIFDHIMSGIKGYKLPDSISHHLLVTVGEVIHEMRIAELIDGTVKRTSAELTFQDISCRPLGFLIGGVLSTEIPLIRPGFTPADSGRWSLGVSRDHCELQSLDGGPFIYLCASLSGNRETDFTFVYGESSSIAFFDAELRDRFTIEETGSGIIAWSHNRSAEIHENDLASLGRALFMKRGVKLQS